MWYYQASSSDDHSFRVEGTQGAFQKGNRVMVKGQGINKGRVGVIHTTNVCPYKGRDYIKVWLDNDTKANGIDIQNLVKVPPDTKESAEVADAVRKRMAVKRAKEANKKQELELERQRVSAEFFEKNRSVEIKHGMYNGQRGAMIGNKAVIYNNAVCIRVGITTDIRNIDIHVQPRYLRKLDHRRETVEEIEADRRRSLANKATVLKDVPLERDCRVIHTDKSLGIGTVKKFNRTSKSWQVIFDSGIIMICSINQLSVVGRPAFTPWYPDARGGSAASQVKRVSHFSPPGEDDDAERPLLEDIMKNVRSIAEFEKIYRSHGVKFEMAGPGFAQRSNYTEGDLEQVLFDFKNDRAKFHEKVRSYIDSFIRHDKKLIFRDLDARQAGFTFPTDEIFQGICYPAPAKFGGRSGDVTRIDDDDDDDESSGVVMVLEHDEIVEKNPTTGIITFLIFFYFSCPSDLNIAMGFRDAIKRNVKPYAAKGIIKPRSLEVNETHRALTLSSAPAGRVAAIPGTDREPYPMFLMNKKKRERVPFKSIDANSPPPKRRIEIDLCSSSSEDDDL